MTDWRSCSKTPESSRSRTDQLTRPNLTEYVRLGPILSRMWPVLTHLLPVLTCLLPVLTRLLHVFSRLLPALNSLLPVLPRLLPAQAFDTLQPISPFSLKSYIFLHF